MKQRNWGLALNRLNRGSWFHRRSGGREKKEDGLTFCGNMCGRFVFLFVSKLHIHLSDPSGMYPQSPNLDLLIRILPCLMSWLDPGRRIFAFCPRSIPMEVLGRSMEAGGNQKNLSRILSSLEVLRVCRYVVLLTCKLGKCFRFCLSLEHLNVWLVPAMHQFHRLYIG